MEHQDTYFECSFKIAENTFREIEDPFGHEKSKKFIFYAPIKNVPEGIPMATNPREQKLTSGVAVAIKDSLLLNDGYFHLKNRGIVLSAHKVTFNNRINEVKLEFKDDDCHGNIDGGHTYKIICEHKNDEQSIDQYVQFEVMTGVEDIIDQLARARNTSIQVDEKSLAELSNKFDPIKEGIKNLPFFNRIAFKMNQIEENTGKKCDIDARIIIAIINMFNTDMYNSERHPIQSYSSKESVLKKYLNNTEDYYKFINISQDIFYLYDAIETELPEAYNRKSGRKYGRKKFSGYNENKVIGKSLFLQKDIFYKVPSGFIYPILGSFRALVEIDTNTGKYKWIKDPFKVWEGLKFILVDKIMEYSRSIGDNPNKIGKENNAWSLEYMTMQINI